MKTSKTTLSIRFLTKLLVMCTLLVLSTSVLGCDKEKGLKIKKVVPATGPAAGAGTVTIWGNGFGETAMGVDVYFGDKKARFLRFEGDDRMLVVPPAGKVGTKVDIEVIFADGRQHKMPEAFSYIDPQIGFSDAPSKE